MCLELTLRVHEQTVPHKLQLVTPRSQSRRRFFTGIDVSVRYLIFVERVAFSKHKLSLSLPADDNTIGRLLLILDVGANAGLNKDEVLLAIGSVSS